MKKYTVLTGATGLLGAFLLKDLLRADVPVAVLVRSSRMESADQRIEGILRRFERMLGRPLPRPVVLEADLHRPTLGLSREQKNWLSRHADTMFHNAASLSFVAEEDGEPYKSNIDGTQHVLDLCRETGIRRFHHVSTAYVCGCRKGKIMESELDDSGGFGNDYEKSKFASETMVRNCKHLDSVTVFRPAIIVGDSETGYTSTFHGFYAPMKILVPLIDPTTVDVEGVSEFGRVIGMNPDDRKNFVPVDWISRVMTVVAQSSHLHGSCYHLAAANRISIREMSSRIAEGIVRYQQSHSGSALAGSVELEKLLPLFHEQMKVYQAYWRDDPEFDMTNTRQAVPEHPPIEMTSQLLMTFIRYAIKSRFGWPKPKPTVIGFSSEDTFRRGCGIESLDAKIVATTPLFGLRLTGSGGGDWTVCQNSNGNFSVMFGLNEAIPLMTMNTIVFRSLTENSLKNDLFHRVSWEAGTSEDFACAIQAVQSIAKGGSIQ